MTDTYRTRSSHPEFEGGSRWSRAGGVSSRNDPADERAFRVGSYDQNRRRPSAGRADDVVPILGMIIGGTIGCVAAAMFTGSRSRSRQGVGPLRGAGTGQERARNTWVGGTSSRRAVEHDESTDLIASNKVEGTAVYNREGERLGEVYNFMVGKRSGRVAYAVMSFGGFLGIGQRYHALPWNVLTYDTEKGGYVIDASKDRLLEAPSHQDGEDPFSRSDDMQRIRDYWSGGLSL